MMTMTTTYLADTSIWIDFLRREGSTLRPFIAANTAGHSEPVSMELLAGSRTADARREVERLLLRSPLLQFDSASDFGAATELRRSALSQRLRVGLVDCMILAVAGRHGVPLLTLDRGQAALAQSHGIPVTLPVD
jgi:predicted nucleic acid-binding protein